jgi:hypothetical protein
VVGTVSVTAAVKAEVASTLNQDTEV